MILGPVTSTVSFVGDTNRVCRVGEAYRKCGYVCLKVGYGIDGMKLGGYRSWTGMHVQTWSLGIDMQAGERVRRGGIRPTHPAIS